MKFKIYYASGVGGETIDMKDGPDEIEDFKNRDKAIRYAWEMACQEYEQYAGMYGIPDTGDEDYEEERESSIDYDVVPVVGQHKKSIKRS